MSEKSSTKTSAQSNSAPKPRCAWSGQTGSGESSKKLKSLSDLGLMVKGESIQLYTLPEHESKVRAFVRYYQRFQALFRGLIAAGLAGIFLAMFAGMTWLEPYAWFFVGVVLLVFPFANNPTFQGLNLRNSTRLARSVAVGCMGMGLFLFF
jgi:hypothetical protein